MILAPRHQNNNNNLLVASLSALAVVAAASKIQAYETFGCDKVWGSESIDNTITSCMTNITHIATLFDSGAERAELGGTLIPLAIVVLTFFIYPIFIALRYCVDFCGSNKRRPGYCCYGGDQWDGFDPYTKNYEYQKNYSTTITVVRALAYISFFVGFVAMGLLFVGTGDLQAGYDTIFTQLYSIVTWAENKESNIRSYVQYDNGSFIAPVNQTLLDLVRTAVSGVDSDLRAVKSSNEQYVDIIKIVAIVFAVLPVPLLGLSVIFAAFDIRRCGPCLNSLFMFILLLFYGFISFACFFVGVVSDRVCGERDAAYNLEPGIGTYWLRPACEQISAFSDIITYFDYVDKASSINSCNLLAYHCDSGSPAYNGLAPEKIFYCPQLTDPSTQCNNATEVENIFYDASIVPLTGGGPDCSAANAEVCAIKNCKDNCSDAAQKSISKELFTAQTAASDIQSADDLFTSELGNCSALIRTTMEKWSSCDDIKGSVFYVGVGSTVYVGLLLIGLVVVFKGQKVFFKPLKIYTKKKKGKKGSTSSPGGSGQVTPQQVTPRNSPQRTRGRSSSAKYRK